LHVTSHAHAFVQVMSPHAFAPLQVIVHCEVLAHVMSPQAPAPHVIRQRNPAGQVKSSPWVSVTMHVGGVLAVLHVLQCAGQPEVVCFTQ